MEKPSPVFSVIMNCHNSSRYLREAVESVLCQTYPNWELVFWDNQSVDESAAIFKSYTDERLKYFYAERHTGLSEGRKLAAAKANGKFLAFLDCDDIWSTVKLQNQFLVLSGDDSIGIAYSPYELLFEDSSAVAVKQAAYYRSIQPLPHQACNIYERLLEGNYIIFSSVVLRKDDYDATVGFDTTLHQNEDYDILLKVARLSAAICVNDKDVIYRIHSSNTSYQNGEKNFLENRHIFSKNLPQDASVKKAITRNETKYGLYQLAYLKKITGIATILQKGSMILLFGILFRKIIKKVN